MPERAKQLLYAALPVLAAVAAVWLMPRIQSWYAGSDSVRAPIVCLLAASLLHPRIRFLLTIALCYGVALLALRDMFAAQAFVPPPAMDTEAMEQAKPIAMIAVAGLAVSAGVLETYDPGTVLARRLYFGAAALYFSGQGLVKYFWSPSWYAIMLIAIGAAAFAGCLLAHRLVIAEREPEERSSDSDEAIQRLTEAAHRRALQDKEWHESIAGPPADREESACRPV